MSEVATKNKRAAKCRRKADLLFPNDAVKATEYYNLCIEGGN
jgi:hypothetical protein